MNNAIRTSIDSSGRLVVPKAIRDQARLAPGMPLEIRYADGRIEIEPAPRAVRIITKGCLQVAIPAGDSEPLAERTVLATRDDLRSR